MDIEVTVSFSGARKASNFWQNALADGLEAGGFNAESMRPKKPRRKRVCNGMRRAMVNGFETVVPSPIKKN